ncbi:MAG TPA: sulfite exporter TauE/SafE family protein [Candidatus Limnocylindrales bacterium]|nr:sulfite exporter TauE/SafE family protein [Candidatus Limnocylindrales bacterium]
MEIAVLLIVGGIATGVFGALLGLGGGVLLVPLLTLGFNLPVREAVGVSLVCVIVTSAASAAVFLDRGAANLRLGMVLELFTAVGALIGGLIAFLLDERLLAGLFAVLLVYTAATMLRPRRAVAATDSTLPPPAPAVPSSPAQGRILDGMSGPDYRVRAPVSGAVGGVGGGIVSALLGIGGGLVMVPVMHLLMGVPLRVATATSNFMIAITASTSAIVYLLRGGIDPYATAPAALGVFLGATVGSRIAHRVDVRVLRFLFAAVLAYTAYLMARRAVGMP